MRYALLAALVASASPAATAPALETTLTGGFIQYWNSYTSDSGTALSTQQWKEIVRAMKKARMDTVVLQHLVWEEGPWSKDGVSYSFMRDRNDPTLAILDEAAVDPKMKVYVGLWHRQLPTTQLTRANLEWAVTRTKAVFADARQRYGTHPALTGWYLPLELWNFSALDDTQVQAIRNYYDIGVKLAAGKPVMIAPYFNPAEEFASEATTRETYKTLLDHTGVDIVAIQDGVGARTWAKMQGHVGGYVEAFRAAATAANAETWVTVEIQESETVSADMERIRKQLALVPKGVKAIAWDFLLYMDPVHEDKAYQGADKARRKKLYDSYLAALTP